jgi:acetyltransferase-like isoleucine patch superfamily enzyme
MKVIKKHLFHLYELLYILIYRILYLKKHIYLARNVEFTKQTIFESNIKIYKNVQIKNSRIGTGTYINSNCILPDTIIGRYCSLAKNIKIIRGAHPSSNFVSTHPAFFSPLKPAGFTFAEKLLFEELKYIDLENKYFIQIGNDVWIGEGVMILQGLRIGDGAIVGAGAVVTRDIEPYSINVGIPARSIKYRFSKEQIQWLLNIKWWNLPFDEIKGISHLFNNIESLRNYFEINNYEM